MPRGLLVAHPGSRRQPAGGASPAYPLAEVPAAGLELRYRVERIDVRVVEIARDYLAQNLKEARRTRGIMRVHVPAGFAFSDLRGVRRCPRGSARADPQGFQARVGVVPPV